MHLNSPLARGLNSKGTVGLVLQKAHSRPECDLPFFCWYCGLQTGKRGWLLHKHACPLGGGGFGGKLTVVWSFKHFPVGAWMEHDSGVQVSKSLSLSCRTHLHNNRPAPVNNRKILQRPTFGPGFRGSVGGGMTLLLAEHKIQHRPSLSPPEKF